MMAKQPDGISSVISLPKGGGALQGIGEKFSPDLFTGTGNFTVPLAVPPGRNGFQPELNLVYSTGTGNGSFGLGWALSVPGVSRKTSKGIPVYDDTEDVFILSGAEDLVPTEIDTHTGYRPRTESLFARINHYRDGSNDYWKVESKDGLVSFYGTPQPANVPQEWRDPAVIADPGKIGKIFAWKLTETRDPFGNRIIYEYNRDIGDPPNRPWDQLYLKRIQYIDYNKADDGTEQFLASVNFLYEDQDRPDPFSDYRAGFEIRTRKRCKRINIRIHADKEHLVRFYELVYLDQRNDLKERLPLNRASLLSQLKVTGKDGDQAEYLPPLEFGYSQFEPKGRQFFPLSGQLPARSLANSTLEMVDLLGNGLPDIVEMNQTVRYWRNLGDGRFDLPRPMRDAPAGLSLSDAGVQLIDADGDGRIDLLATVNGLSGYYPLEFSGEWDRRSFQRYRTAPSFNLEDPEVRLVDLTGDGVTDAIRSGTRLECFFNDPTEGWKDNRRVTRKALEAFPNVNFSDPRVKWADMSGDGLQDIVLVYDGNVEYWPNLGCGSWARRIHMKNSPRFPYGYDPKRILVGDVDGDGLADLVYVDNRKVLLWINQGGNAWSDAIEIDGTPPVTDMDAVRLVDLLGTGISGVLWSKDAVTPASENYYFLDFTGGIKPYLLNEMDNHMGALTRVEYRPSTEYYLQDQKRPETRWKTSLPFPVQVVATVEVVDTISKGQLTTEYSYHHGYWDGGEREFRGFGRVDQRDTEAFDRYNATVLHPKDTFNVVSRKFFSPPVETRTWFHLGPVGDETGDWKETDFSGEFWSGDAQMLDRPSSMKNFLKELPRRVKRNALRALRGRILRTELYALDSTPREDRPYTVTEYLHGVTALAVTGSWPDIPAEWQKDVFFPHSLAQRVTQWERGDDPMTRFSFTADCDDYGQPRKQTRIACPRGWKGMNKVPQKAYLATLSKTEYAKPGASQHYIMDRAAKTTTYEIVNKGADTVLNLKNTADGSNNLKVIGQTLIYYDGQPYQGLDFGKVGQYGVVVRAETLILTPDILDKAYLSVDAAPNVPEIPPYLTNAAAPNWTPEYPQEFRTLLKQQAGYAYHAGGANDEHVRGYFVATYQKYDFHEPQAEGRGLPTTNKDALGREIKIVYDSYRLLPTQVTDPAKLTTKADYDYRLLQPEQVTDPNGNRTRYTYTPLGLLDSTAVMGKLNENRGDTDQAPGIRFKYDFLAFNNSPANARQPISVHSIRRIHHINDTGVDITERDQTIETIEYSDGFGRLLQTRTQAEYILFGNANFGDAGLDSDQSAPNRNAIGKPPCAGGQVNVVVSGWQTFDNKGRVVEKYEPFFSCGWDYAPMKNGQKGQKATLFYDPRGQVICTLNPDGSQQRVIYGKPADLSDPIQFTPTPWEFYTYDENDNGGRSHFDDTLAYKDHCNTPASAEVDALGRTIKTTERNGPNQDDRYTTESTYDIRGNLLTIKDALKRTAFSYIYDLTPAASEEGEDEEGAQVLRIEQLDAGVLRIVFDAAGNEIERRDSKGALILQAHDDLDRPIQLWARDNSDEGMTLREHLIYGDSAESGLTQNQVEAANLCGELYRHYDEAGRLTFEVYDFKGNLMKKSRQVISDAVILAVFNPPPPNWEVKPFRVDWQPPAGITLNTYADGLLDATVYQTSLTYDGLNRVTSMHYPQNVDGGRKVLSPIYNRAGALEQVELDGSAYVKQIAYNAKRQRTLIVYGNGVMTRYAYDPKTFRLNRMRTERYTMPNGLTYHPAGQALQDFGYEYDLAGNILKITDRTPGSGISNSMSGNDALDRSFSYDPIYRLLSATGRECDSLHGSKPWDDAPKCQDAGLTRGYKEAYAYDAVGNMTQLAHTAGLGGFVRDFTLIPKTNRLQLMTVGRSSYAYQYDVNGNMVRENTTRHFEWDHSDQLRVFRNQIIGNQPSVHVQYLYDADGQRVKKLARKQNDGTVEVTVYINEMFEHHRQVNGGVTKQNNTLHVMDDERRIAMVRVENAMDTSDTSPAVQYQLGDHLGSSNVVVNADGTWINREEFTPYGETSFGRYAGKCYRFTGKERDEESGFNYHGARYYAPWLGRWMILDPVGGRKGNSRYVYVHNNPLKYVDCKGTQESLPPDRRKIFENLRTKLLMDTSDLAETANNIFMHLHALQYITYEAYVRKLTAWTTPFSAKETYRKPTKLEQKEAAELINSFIAKSINEAVLSNNTKHLEGKSLELYILKRAFRISQKVRQGADVKDTPSLVAAEQYLTARTLFATPPTGSENIDVPEQYVNGVTAVAATFFYDEIVKNTPILSYPLTLFLKASKKPMSPPWVWTRAWKYLGSWHIINPPK